MSSAITVPMYNFSLFGRVNAVLVPFFACPDRHPSSPILSLSRAFFVKLIFFSLR